MSQSPNFPVPLLDRFRTPLVIAATLLAIVMISVAGISKVLASNLTEPICTDRPWVCGGESAAIVEAGRHSFRHERARASRHGLSVSDLIGTLQSKVSEIISACGAKLVSGYRPGARIAGTGHASLHSVYPARAADMSGNPNCVYAHLTNWQGGYSTDYGRVRHVHISYSPPGSGYLGGREWHARFAHGGGYHHHRHHRTARA